MPSFNYSGRAIILISDYYIKKHVKIFRVKKLSARSQWYENQEKDQIYLDDILSHSKGIGSKSVPKLNAVRIMTCGDMCNLNTDLNLVPGITHKKLQEY